MTCRWIVQIIKSLFDAFQHHEMIESPKDDHRLVDLIKPFKVHAQAFGVQSVMFGRLDNV